MRTPHLFQPFSLMAAIMAATFLLLSVLACTTEPEIVTPYRPPTLQATLPPRAPAIVPGGPLPAQQNVGSTGDAIPTPTPFCTNVLSYIDDLTIPDGTRVPPNSTIDKRWLIENTGSCNWDSRYRLRLVEGEALNAPTEQALYPARGGSQFALRIIFTAPNEPGTYTTTWQAIAPNGTPFGDTFYMQIIVVGE